MKRLLIVVLQISGARIYTLLISLLSLVLTARTLGPEGRGIIAATIAWLTILSTVCSLSVGQVIIHRFSKERCKKWIAEIVGNVFVVWIIVSVATVSLIAFTIFLKINLFGGMPSWAILSVVIVLPFFIWEKYGAQILTCSGNIGFLNKRQIFFSTTYLIVLFVGLIIYNGQTKTALIIVLIGGIGISCSGIFKIWNIANRKFIVSRGSVCQLLIDGMKIHANTVGSISLLWVNVVIVNYYGVPSDVGIYQLALQMALVLTIVPQATGMALNYLMSEQGVDRMWTIQKRILALMLIVTGILGLIAYLIAPWLISILAGPSFEPAVSVFRVLLLGVIGFAAAYGMANQWLGRGLFWQSSILSISMAIVHVIISMIIIPKYGIMGAAWSWVAVYAFFLLANGIMVIYVDSRAT